MQVILLNIYYDFESFIFPFPDRIFRIFSGDKHSLGKGLLKLLMRFHPNTRRLGEHLLQSCM